MIHPYSYKTGLITGGVLCLLYIALYLIGIEVYTNFILPFIIMIGMLVYFILSSKKVKQMMGEITFVQVLLNFLVMAGLTTTIANLFNYVLIYVIDPEFGEQMGVVIIEKTIAMMEGFGAPEVSITEAVADMEVQFAEQASLSGTIVGILKAIAFWAIPGVVVAAVLRTKPGATPETLD